MAKFNIAVIGLPSSGKSTMINSLIKQRVLQSGVCRTTTDIHYIGSENEFNFPNERFHRHHPISDDGINFSIIDLPGIADSENTKKEKSFDEMTSAWIEKADIVMWTSDIQTAFITT